MTNLISRESPPPGGPELTVEELAPLWRISEYTLREWAGEGLIDGAVQRGGRWRFPAHPRLKAPVRPGATVGSDFMLVDLAEFPLTPKSVAFRWNCAEATIRSWARQNMLGPCVWLARGWRFRERVRLLRNAPRFPHQSRQREPQVPDPLKSLGSLRYRQCTRAPRKGS
ncbi:MAG: helix-turn-helix domain-containing protein [Gemmatimonadaceae bacterium]